MDPLVMLLLAIPVNLVATLTYALLRDLSRSIDTEPLKDLFVSSFFQAVKSHNKHYDETSKKLMIPVKRAIRQDKDRLLSAFSRLYTDFNEFLLLVNKEEFNTRAAREIMSEFSLESVVDRELLEEVIADCLRFYRAAFFRRMTEEDRSIAILIQSLRTSDLQKEIRSEILHVHIQ